MSKLKTIDKYVGKVLNVLTVTLLVVLLILLTINIFLRIVPIYNLSWFDEIVEFSFAWLVFLGAALLWKNKEHSRVDFLPERLKGKVSGAVLNLVNDTISLIFVLIFVIFSFKFIGKVTAVSPILQVPREYFYYAMPISAFIMCVYSIVFVINDILVFKRRGK